MSALEAIFSWVLTTTWQASVLAVLVLALQWILGRRLNPRWRHALWLLVVLRLLLPSLPASSLSLYQIAPSSPLNLPETIPTPELGEQINNATPLAPPVPHEVIVSQPNSLFLFLAVIWLSGALGLLLLTWLVNGRFARHVANAPQITDESLRRILSEAKAELGVRRNIRLIESSRVQSPAIMGLFTPTLLLPLGSQDKFNPRELRFIFLHELAHLKRGDVFVQALVALLQVIHWFNPVLWYAFRRLRADREPATDALVLSRTGEADKESYGLMLIKLLEHFNQRHSLPTLVGILEDKDQFKRRFSLIARFTRGAYGWSLLGVALLALLGAICLTKAKANSSAPSQPEAQKSTPPQKSLAEQLRSAVLDGDAAQVQKLIDAGADPKAGQPNGETLLFFAGSPEVAELLIQHGVDVKARDHQQRTAINYIGWNRHKTAETIRVLLQHGADPNAKDSFGTTPLMDVFDAASVDVLVKAGADVNARDKQDTPVIGHLYASNVGKLKELLTLGAHFDAKTDGPTLLMEAAHMGNLDLLTYILGLGVDPNAKGTWNKEAEMYLRPLECAITSGHLDAARLLIAHGAKIDPKDVQNALANHRKDIVRFFWEQGTRTISELTYQISQGASEAVIQKLLDAGASANPPQDSPYSPLALASELGRLDLVQLLVQHGAVINPASAKKDDIWDSPIDDAAWEGQDEVVTFLLQHGAKPGYRTLWNVAWNVNPYEGEQRSKDHFEKTLKLLLDAGALNGLSPEERGRLLDAVIDTRNPGGNAAALKMLLAAGLSPNLPMTDDKGKNYGTVLSYYRDLRAKTPQDDFKIFPLIDLLEVALKSAPQPGSDAASTNVNNAPLDFRIPSNANGTITSEGTTVLADQHLPVPPPAPWDNTSNTYSGGTTIAGTTNLAVPGIAPPHDPALDKKLVDLLRNPSTDKVGAGDADKVAQLLAQGADPNAKSGGAPALIWALNFGKDDAAATLIQNGADVNATDGRMSAVELASMIYYCPNALDALLKKGAHLQPPGAPPRSVLDAVFSAGPAAAGKMNYLRDRPWTDADYQAWAQRQRRVIDLLAAAGVDLNGVPGGNPPLIHAIRGGHLDAARELLKLGAKTDVHDANGETPQSAAQQFHPEFLPELQAAAAKTHEADAAPSPDSSNDAALALKLDTVQVDLPAFSEAALNDIVIKFSQAIVSGDPAHEGFIFVVPRTAKAQAMRLDLPAMKDVPAIDALAAIAKAGQLTYKMDARAIYLRPRADEAGVMPVRTFLIPSGFFMAVNQDQTNVESQLLARGIPFAGGSSAIFLPAMNKLVVRDAPDALDTLQTMIQAAATASPQATPVSSVHADAPAPSTSRDYVRLEVKVLQISEEDYQGHRSDIDAALKTGDVRPLIALKSCSVLSEPAVAMRSGQRGVVEVVRVFPFPTQFKRDATGSLTPTEFAQRDIGVRFPVTATITGDKISVNGELSLSTFRGWTQTGLNTFSPGIDTQEAYFYDELSSGQTRGIATAGTEVADLNSPPAAPAAESAPPKLVRLFFFLTAEALTENELHAGVPPADATFQGNTVTAAIPGGSAGLIVDPRTNLENDLHQAKLDADARHVLVDQVQNLPDDQFLATLEGLGRNTPEIAELDKKIGEENADISRLLSAGFTADHPRVVSIRAEVTAREADRHRLVEGLHRAMAIDLQMADSRVTLLQKELAFAVQAPTNP